jgi:hypothetical protein
MDKVTRKFYWFMVGQDENSIGKIIDALLNVVYSISFDAPAHGKSPAINL